MKDLKINFKNLPSQILLKLQKLSKYSTIIFIITVLIAYSFLIWRINNLNQAQPSDDAITEKLTITKLPKIDQSTIDKLKQLEDNSSEVQALFKQARQNPFQE